MSKSITPEALVLTLETISATYPGSKVSHKGDVVKLEIPEGEGMEVKFQFYERGGIGCETLYTAQGKRYTRDRLGIEASLYWESKAKLPSQIAEQVEIVKQKQEQLAQCKPFNLGPVTIMITPKQKDEIIATLRAGKTHTYHPPGFGTGYYFSINPKIRNRYDRAVASAELVDWVGKNVYVSSFDAD